MNEQSFLRRLPTHECRLDNGLTVLIREDHSAPVVAVVTHVQAGYFNEPDTLVGISHVLEHMYFKGTERLGAGEIARVTKAAGGYLNAGTIYDYTTYYTVLPSSALEQGLEVQADALRNSAIDEDELRRELEVIIQEAKRKLDNPNAVVRESLFEAMFEVHRMRRWRIGTEDALRRLTREDVWRYYRELYHPANIVLVVAGDVDAERTLALVERLYGDMPAGETVSEPSPEEPERQGLRFREMTGDLTQSYLEWGWRTPGTLHPDTPALDLLSTVLGQGRASRLYQGVREAGLVNSIGAWNYTPTELGVFGVSAELEPAQARAAIEAAWREVHGLHATPPGEAELQRAKNILEARMLRRTETAEGQASLLAEWQSVGDWRLAEDYLDRLLAVTVEDVQRVARRYLDPELATVLVYRPERTDALGWGADELREIIAAIPERAGVAGRGAVDVPAAPAADQHAAADAEARGAEDGVHFYALPGGVRLAVKPQTASPLVSMGVFVRGGMLDELPEQAGITSLLARASLKGTRSHTAAALAEEVEALGGSISPGVGSDLFSWATAVPSRHFARAFPLLADVALRPSLPEQELERERRIALSDLAQLRDDMYRYPMRLFLQSAFAGHPYGIPTGVMEESLGGLTRDDIAAWHRRTVLEARPWVIVVGDVEPDAAAAVIARSIEGDVVAAPERDDARAATWPDGPRVEADHRAKAQTALVIGMPGPDYRHPDAYALQVLSSAVSGLGGRLFEELRSRRSLAYTVSAYPITRRCGGSFVSYIATSPEREDEARQGLLEELERLATDPLGADEVARAQEYTIGAWKIRSQTNSAQLGDLAYALLLGRGVAEIREFEERVRALTPEAIRDAFARYYAPDLLVEGIVRGTGAGR